MKDIITQELAIGDLVANVGSSRIYIGIVYDMTDSGFVKYYDVWEDWDDSSHYKPTGKWNKYKRYCKPNKIVKITIEQMSNLIWLDHSMATAYTENRVNRIAEYVRLSEEMKRT